MDIEYHILCLAARTSLSERAHAHLVEALHGRVNWERLWKITLLHQVWPLVYLNVHRLKDSAPIPAAWLDRSRQRYFDTMYENALLADETLRVVGVLKEAGIESLPVKGVVLAQTVYGNLTLRPAGDIDVLVRQLDLPTARRALRSLGYADAPDPDFGRLNHALHDPPYFVGVGGRTLRLELHWALWAPHLFPIDSDLLWKRVVPVQLHGAPIHTLSPEDTLLHLAIHHTRSSLRLRLVCDIAEFLRVHSTTLDWDYVLRQVDQGGARTALHTILTNACDLLDATTPPQTLRALGIGPLKRRLLHRMVGPQAYMYEHPRGIPRELSFSQRLVTLDGAHNLRRAIRYHVPRGVKYLKSVIHAPNSIDHDRDQPSSHPSP